MLLPSMINVIIFKKLVNIVIRGLSLQDFYYHSLILGHMYTVQNDEIPLLSRQRISCVSRLFSFIIVTNFSSRKIVRFRARVNKKVTVTIIIIFIFINLLISLNKPLLTAINSCLDKRCYQLVDVQFGRYRIQYYFTNLKHFRNIEEKSYLLIYNYNLL